MEVTKKDVIHCARLAQIGLSSDLLEMLRQDMAKILNHAKNLDQLNLDFVEPYSNSAPLPKRIDNIEFISISQLEALENAPQTYGSYFLVPKVM